MNSLILAVWVACGMAVFGASMNTPKFRAAFEEKPGATLALTVVAWPALVGSTLVKMAREGGKCSDAL